MKKSRGKSRSSLRADALRASSGVHEQIIRSAKEGIIVFDRDLRYVVWNPFMEQFMGVPAEEILGKRTAEAFPYLNEWGIVRAQERALAGERVDLPDALMTSARTGERRWLSVSYAPLYSTRNRVLGVVCMVRDIHARKQAEDKVDRLNRVYAMLSGINSVIVRVRDWRELFHEACRLAVATGKFRLAWVGVVDATTGQLQTVASDGADPEFLAQWDATLLQDAATRRGMVWRAVSERRPTIVNDIEQDQQVILMRAAMTARGVRAVAILPLIVAGEVAGVLALHASEVGIFDDTEIQVLNNLASDIAFGLDHIRKEERINYLAYYDSLTGLANRALFHDRLTQFTQSAQRESQQLVLCVLDLDHFKSVNDALGRQSGDSLLGQFAQRLLQATHDASQVARLGADRFALVLPDVRDERDALRQIDSRINQCIGQPFLFDDMELRIAVRMGIAMFPGDGVDGEALFHNAEAALKKAKSNSERYLFYRREMSERIGERLQLETKLRRAIENEEFVLHYQPKFDAVTRRLTGVEALVRWRDPRSGMIPPASFIPLLEETGLILEVGTWVVQRAIEDHLYWLAKGVVAPRIAVNVSAAQLRQRNFIDIIRGAVVYSNRPACLELEITESLLMHDIESNIETLREVTLLGVEVAVDDFGTGYSSLGYLARLPVQVMKIDVAFIGRMLEDPGTLTLVTTMISLAHSLRLRVVAEGVEVEAQASALQGLGCDELQGYLLGQPLPREQMLAFLRTQERTDAA